MKSSSNATFYCISSCILRNAWNLTSILVYNDSFSCFACSQTQLVLKHNPDEFVSLN